MNSIEVEEGEQGGEANPRGTSLSGHHRPYRGKSDVWLTPPHIVEALGPFDLDPCTLPDGERPWDTAKVHYWEELDGLAQPWSLADCPTCGLFNPGRFLADGERAICLKCESIGFVLPTYVWMNPPFGAEGSKWLRRMADHGNGVALYHARTETDAFHRYVWERASGILFLEGRLNFHRPDGTRASTNSGCPVCLIAYGEYAANRLEFNHLGGKYVGL